MGTILERFTQATAEWFRSAFSGPTAVQEAAWDAISSGENALVVAPTGSGKTLAAFLWSLDGLIAQDSSSSGRSESTTTPPLTRVLYVSPLKALGVDVERNLRSPLIGIRQTALRQGLPAAEISVGVRSGDTPPKERRRLASHPPDILITTPESLFLMLTSKARGTLANVQTVIVDEVHAVAGTKRGAHLAVTLARLDAFLASQGQPAAQRIGLSATVEPRELVAEFLTGGAPCRVVAPASGKVWDLTVTVPLEDMSNLGGGGVLRGTPPVPLPGTPQASAPEPRTPSFGADVFPTFADTVASLGKTPDSILGTSPGNKSALTGAGTGHVAERSGFAPEGSIWPHVEERIVDHVLAKHSTIVFANSRRLAERLTGRLNEIYADRLGFGLQEDPPRQPPAQIMAQAGQSKSADPEAPLLARAHHGSVSKDQRALIEEALKKGELRCVVATSSLELGIDMGLVDQVIQVESPPSVASGLQRVGRAGHGVGEVSRGLFYPKHRGDLLNTAITVIGMREGRIEPIRIPRNPLDILAQQTVAACALEPLDATEWFETLRRSAPFRSLPRSAYDATLDLLSGRYPSDEFAELRPRIVWDRAAGTLVGRPGAQRLAVTSGGTIPDRGLFGVYLASAEGERGGKRVGELDEEMVYESRIGDVFALGATSWRIQDITHDRVLVTPAFGEPGKLPFWRGDALGRPVELGEALGAFLREAGAADTLPAGMASQLEEAGLDPFALGNLSRYIAEQRQATGVVPSDRRLVVERFKDEVGDWRIVLHSPYGMPVHSPWALAVGARVQARYGIDASAMAADDGIILRVPATDEEPPGAELFLFEADELEDIVTREVGGSALFAARFRECAARALLLPRRDPGKRTPLWQQRQRASQLLQVARKYPHFPIILEAVRECLQDVYDLPALTRIARRIAQREIVLTDVTTPAPSPFAKSLLFGYVATFLYEGDSPLAERRAAALALDPGLLAELLGRVELRELLDEGVVRDVEQELQRLAPSRRLRGVEGAADLLRLLGPLSIAEASHRLDSDSMGGSASVHGLAASETGISPDGPPAGGPQHATEEETRSVFAELQRTRRAFTTRIAGREVIAAVEDAARLRDALGAPIPHGVPADFLEPMAQPVEDLVARHLRTHASATCPEIASRLGLGQSVVAAALRSLVLDGRAVEGAFRPQAIPGVSEYCDADVLRQIRRRSLARLRREVEPVDAPTLGRFLPAWHQVIGSQAGAEELQGSDGLLSVVEQLTGALIPASALETLVLPSRVAGYRPAMLDELLASGDVLIQGHGSLPGNDGWVSLHLAETADLTLSPPRALLEAEASGLRGDLLHFMTGNGAFFPRQLAEASIERTGLSIPPAELARGLWEMFWDSAATFDSLGPIRSLLSGGSSAHKKSASPSRARSLRPSLMRRASLRRSALGQPGSENAREGSAGEPPAFSEASGIAARWSILPSCEPDPTIRLTASTHLLLDRHGVLTRGAVAAEDTPGGFSAVYKIASQLEEAGLARRGYFVEKLGAAQFASSETVDRLRGFTEEALRVPGTDERSHRPVVALAATDPANPYGAALPWPEKEGHRPGRKAGAVVVLVDGSLALYVERGGRTVLTFARRSENLARAAAAYADAIRRGGIGPVSIEKIDGRELTGAASHPVTQSLAENGFYATPRGVKYRP